MKTFTFNAVLILLFISQVAKSQGTDLKFKMHGTKSETFTLNETFTSSQEIFPFDKNKERIYGLAVSADIRLIDEESVVRLFLFDDNYNEYLVYESYALLDGTGSFSIEDVCEETTILDGVKAISVKVEVSGAEITLNNITISTQLDPSVKIDQIKKEKKQLQNENKINRINENLKAKGKKWVAGPTNVSELSYSDRKKLYGGSTFPPAFEYYAGGIISSGTSDTEVSTLKSATTTAFADEWDWRNRHGKNWITPVVNQGLCGSCWSFAAAGATEALTNLYFNRQINLNLSEQDLISCSGAGGCNGGFPSIALDYITNNGIVDEATFPYSKTDEPCNNKGSAPSELIKISGRIDFGFDKYSKTEEGLKQMLIELGPVSGGLYDWSHAMVLIGYKVVKEGDVFYYRGLDLQMKWVTISAGDPLIGKTVWIFKNSWGGYFGDEGFVYVETTISNMGWTHGLKTPVTSNIKSYEVICEDNDGDGYYWWGLGEKPATCNCPDEPDGDDSDPTLGPLDQYGNCRILNGIPSADFTVSSTLLTEGETVNFTDLSTSNSETWSWIFVGGTPVSSNLKNPAVVYETHGIYNVTLTVSNSSGSGTKTIENFLTVEQALDNSEDTFIIDEPIIIEEPIVIDENYTLTYCASKGEATEEWIEAVSMGTQTNASGSSGNSGYQDHTRSMSFNAVSGKNLQFSLKPVFLNRWQQQYWRIWIDYNGDADFDDSGELVFTSALVKGGVSGSFIPPAGISIATRMRISMKRGNVPLPCESFTKGEVEDYLITIEAPAPMPPVADFNGRPANVFTDESVSFSDMSSNDPTHWQWQFPGGKPATSTERNPSVIYNSPGKYDVTLTVSKEGFEPSQSVKTGYITVNENAFADYCIPLAVNSSSNYIQEITIGDAFTSTSAGNGYSMSTTIISLAPGGYYTVSLSPINGTNRFYWRIWTDINNDGDFYDEGETLLALNNKKGEISAGITIPQFVSGETRMRIAMRNKTAPSPCDDGYEGDVRDFPMNFISEPQVSGNTTDNEQVAGNAFILEMYPNPVIDYLVIKLNSVEPGDTYTLYNLNGGKLMSDKILTEQSIIDFSNHTPGIYLIEIIKNTSIHRKKIIKH